jgi:hypothetical protein
MAKAAVDPHFTTFPLPNAGRVVVAGCTSSMMLKGYCMTEVNGSPRAFSNLVSTKEGKRAAATTGRVCA